MKRSAFLILACIYVLRISGQQDTLRVNGNSYLMLKQTEKNEFEGRDTLVKLYRLEQGKRLYLLTHYLYRYGEDCNNTFKDVGTISYRADIMRFETNYFQKGHDPIPEKQTQIYRVKPNGTLILLSDRIYGNGKWVNTKDYSMKH